MTNYLNENITNFNVNIISSPIRPKATLWEIEEKRMYKSYNFEEKRFLEAFVLQILKYNREADANIEFRVKENKVGIIIHALSPTISEIELESSKDIDKIKKDVMYYYAK
jgi:hypothetical protein